MKWASSPLVEEASLKSAPNHPETGGLLHTSTLHGEAAQAPTLSCKCGHPGQGAGGRVLFLQHNAASEQDEIRLPL